VRHQHGAATDGGDERAGLEIAFDDAVAVT